jgi:hypothetical protein
MILGVKIILPVSGATWILENHLGVYCVVFIHMYPRWKNPALQLVLGDYLEENHHMSRKFANKIADVEAWMRGVEASMPRDTYRDYRITQRSIVQLETGVEAVELADPVKLVLQIEGAPPVEIPEPLVATIKGRSSSPPPKRFEPAVLARIISEANRERRGDGAR